MKNRIWIIDYKIQTLNNIGNKDLSYRNLILLNDWSEPWARSNRLLAYFNRKTNQLFEEGKLATAILNGTMSFEYTDEPALAQAYANAGMSSSVSFSTHAACA